MAKSLVSCFFDSRCRLWTSERATVTTCCVITQPRSVWTLTQCDQLDCVCAAASRLTRLQERLCEMVEPDYGLVNELLSRGVITDRDHAMIQAGRDVYTRNDSLLHCLASTELTGDQFQQLIDALDNTGQAHVANFIRGDGGLLFRDCNPGIPAAF